MRPLFVVAFCLAVIGCTAPQDQLTKPSIPEINQIEPGLSGSAGKISEQWWVGLNDPQLTQVIELALAKSPSIEIAGTRIAAAQAIARAQQASLAPQVGFSAQIDEQQFSQNYIFVPGMQIYNGYGFVQANMNWSLDLWGKQRKYFDAANQRVKAAQFNVAAAKLILSSTIAKVYADFDHAHQLKILSVKELDLRDRLYQIAIARQRAGVIDALDAKQKLVDRDLAQGRLTQADLAIKVLQHQLAALAQQGPTWGEKLQAPKLDSFNGELPNVIPANLLARRPDLQVLLAQITAADLDVDAAKLEYLPDVNLQAYAGFQSIGLPLLFQSASQAFSIGPVLSLPIFEGGRIAANALGKEAARNERIATYQDQLTTALKEAADGIATVKSTSVELTQVQRALADSRSYWQIQQQRKIAGLTSSDNVFNAELTVVQQQKQVLDTRTRSLSARISLIQALGGSFETPTDHTAN